MRPSTRALASDQRLRLICRAVEYCQIVRAEGMPTSAYTKALREPIFFLWESYDRSKHESVKFCSEAALGTPREPHALVYDHAIPFRILQEDLLALQAVTPDAIEPLLERGTIAVLIT